MTDLGDRTAKPHPSATLMVYKYLLQRAEMVWGVAWWLWALLWCNIADPFKLSACLSFPATRTQELAGRGVRKCTAGLEMDSWDEKASGWHPLIQIRQTKSPQQLLWSYSANFFLPVWNIYTSDTLMPTCTDVTLFFQFNLHKSQKLSYNRSLCFPT